MAECKNAFQKACTRVLVTGALGVTLATSAFVGTASAQTAGPPPAPDSSMTQTYQDPATQGKPWSNDPDYQALVRAYDAQSNSRQQNYESQANGQIQVIRDNASIQSASQQVNLRGGIQGMLNAGNAQNQVRANESVQEINQKASLDRQMSAETVNRMNYLAGLDRQFQAIPFYQKGGVAPPNAVVPWANDPAYQQKIRDYDQQLNLRRQTAGIQEGAQLRTIDTQLETQTINNQAQMSNYMRQPGGVQIAGYRQDINQTQHDMQIEATRSSYEVRDGQEGASRANFILGLNNQMASTPAYKNAPRFVSAGGTGGQAGPPPAPTMRPPGA